MARMKRLKLLTAACVITAAAGCHTSLTAPTKTAPFGQADLEPGTGAGASNGQTLTVNYIGWLYDSSEPEQKGAIFDQSGTTPFSFVLGAGTVIKGWDQGLVGMEVGGVRRLIVPPSLGYGASRHGIIPPNATLLFEVNLTAVAAAGS
jgi:FKBP-type peptidyl-prolyl cis-trans isomerase FkpA